MVKRVKRSTKAEKPLSRIWYFLISLTEVPHVFFLILFLEVYTIVVLPGLVSVELGVWWIVVVAAVVAVPLLGIQTFMLRKIRKTLGYLAYLAGEATDPEPGDERDITYRVRHFSACLRGMNRIGDLRTGRRFQSLVLKALKEKTCIAPASLSIDQMISVIELAVVDAASKEPKNQIYKPFEAALNPDPFDAPTFTVSKFSILLATQYCNVDAVTKKQVEAAYEKKHVSPATFDMLGKLAPFITAIVGGIATVYALAEKMLN